MARMIELKLDYDGENWFQLYQERMRVLESILGIEVVEEKFFVSASGNHHVRARVSLFSLEGDTIPLTVCLLQALLGSDPVRETFNLRRILRGQVNWNILFNTDPAYREVI